MAAQLLAFITLGRHIGFLLFLRRMHVGFQALLRRLALRPGCRAFRLLDGFAMSFLHEIRVRHDGLLGELLQPSERMRMQQSDNYTFACRNFMHELYQPAFLMRASISR
jgi:hypothetical protein